MIGQKLKQIYEQAVLGPKETRHIEPNRYVDFNGDPIEGGWLKKMGRDYGLWATIAASAIAYNVAGKKNSPDFAIAFGSLGAGITLSRGIRYINRKRTTKFFDGAVVDTNPHYSAQTIHEHQIRAKKQKRLEDICGKVAAITTGLVPALLQNNFGMPLPVTLGTATDAWRRYMMYTRIEDGEWVIIPPDKMERKQPKVVKLGKNTLVSGDLTPIPVSRPSNDHGTRFDIG